MTLGWIGNIFILAALWQIGCKKRIGWLFSIIGNIIWCYYAVELCLWEMLFVDAIALILAVYNWRKWRVL